MAARSEVPVRISGFIAPCILCGPDGIAGRSRFPMLGGRNLKFRLDQAQMRSVAVTN
jgi:hypothetical protein